MFSWVETFENGDLSYLCGRANTEVFKYNDVLHRLPHIRFDNATCGCIFNTEKRISFIENTRLRVDGQIRFENATCGRRFF